MDTAGPTGGRPAVHHLTATGGGRLGGSPTRPDGRLKVTGGFAYASDLHRDGMYHGMTLRSPYPRARIARIDTAAARALPGVAAVLTHRDVPGERYYGLDRPDQPVLAAEEVRYVGEPVALVAAADPETARRALAAITVEYEPLEPLVDPKAALAAGRLVRHQRVVRGDPDSVTADVVVVGEYEVGMQDQAPLGPEAGLAVPRPDGGVDLWVATQWLHVDRRQIAPCLGLPESMVHLVLAGVGGAFGAREDLSVQIHVCLLALRVGAPVRMVYGREESFLGHVHRHPARMRYEHGATSDGRLLYVRARILLDGGAYTSSTAAVVGNAASLGVGPYRCPNVAVDAYGVYTNNPPCGAMRGFGAVQACYAYESQMDALAARLGMDPVDLRVLNAVAEGDALATGQVLDAPAPVAEMLHRLRAMPLPAGPPVPSRPDGPAESTLDRPGGLNNSGHGESVRRGVGYGVGIKNICYSEGFDDSSAARVLLRVAGGEPEAEVRSAAAEVGQGLVTVLAQIAAAEVGVARVTVAPADTDVGSAGSSSASRQSYMSGGAVRLACRAVHERVLALARTRLGRDLPDDVTLADGKLVSASAGVVASLEEVLGGDVVDETREFHHRRTSPLDPRTGQGASHVQFGLCAHRAVVDVDVELGLVRVVELAAVQDVGTVLNRQAVEGQIHGGSTQGLGLAVMEELRLRDGAVANPSFTDYLIPTVCDVPPMPVQILEYADPAAPYGLRGAGEPSTLSSTPAVAAAIRAATGLALTRVPVRPDDIALGG